MLKLTVQQFSRGGVALLYPHHSQCTKPYKTGFWRRVFSGQANPSRTPATPPHFSPEELAAFGASPSLQPPALQPLSVMCSLETCSAP